MSIRQALSTTGDVALQLLRLTAAASDLFPPLKSAASGALHVAEIVKEFRSNKSQWQEFGTYVQDATASVVQSLAQVGASHDDTTRNLEKLQLTLQDVTERIQSEHVLPWHKRFGKFLQDPDMIADMRKRVDDVVDLFQLNTTTTTMIDVKKILEAVRANSKTLSRIDQSTSTTAVLVASNSQSATLEKLRREENSTWDLYKVCLEKTRVELINNILKWIDDADSSGATIMLLTAAAGAGKTTVAHTVAQLCKTKHRLASSFFFSRSTAGRDNPGALFSTIAYDLARLDKRLAAIITAAIEDDRSLPLAPISRQFEELVLSPCRKVSLIGPVVIVIDALDEAWNDTLLEILGDGVRYMPSTVRIFITSRMGPELDSLCREKHVSRLDLEIGEETNMKDMAEYIAYKLRWLANKRNLGNGWPGEKLQAEFEKKAGGLFLWVATICDYLRQRSDPTAELQKLVAGTSMPTTKAEEQMDKLYATILESFDWDDVSFSEGYGRLMGVVIASKIPITVSAMRELYRDQFSVSDYTLQRLSPLLTGTRDGEDGKQPVGLLHQSLRDFLAVRAPRSMEYARFHVAEKDKSAELALLCLNMLNRELDEDMPIVGYLAKHSEAELGVPKMAAGVISDALWYACQFWPDHLVDTGGSADVKGALVYFMENRLVMWLEIVASRGWCRDLDMIQEWMQGQRDGCDEKYADACLSMCDRLEYDDRLEEALAMAKQGYRLYRQLATNDRISNVEKLASSLVQFGNILSRLGDEKNALLKIQEAVEMCRQLAKDQPATYTPILAESLNNLSNRLSFMGQKEEALLAIQEAVEIRRLLTMDQPTTYTPALAESLNNLSNRLSFMGQKEEALLAIQEAVKIRRQLAVDWPAAYTPFLAESLNNLSNRLSYMGQKEEALLVIQEAVEIRRQLAADRPATYTPVLAESLNNLSNRLAYVGQKAEALLAIRESVEIRRQLSADRPAAYTPGLAESLNNLSNRLSYMGQKEEALLAIQEAVEMRRQLATDRPAAYTPGLAESLNNLSNRLAYVGQKAEALLAIRESVEIRRQLAADRPAAYTPGLAESLNNLSNRLSYMGQKEEALLAIQEAVEIRRQLAVDQPAVYTRVLAESLNNLSNRLSDMGQNQEALPILREVLQLYRSLAASLPLLFIPKLSRALSHLARILNALGQREEAEALNDEAASLLRRPPVLVT